MTEQWTIGSYAVHNETIRAIEGRLQEEKISHLAEVISLNDKRYTEGNELRAMALKIKETADANALELASEAQTYKEARNDAMREQSFKDNGIYATRDDLANVVKELRNTLQPLSDYITAQKGSTQKVEAVKSDSFKIIAAIASVLAILATFAAIVTAVMK